MIRKISRRLARKRNDHRARKPSDIPPLFKAELKPGVEPTSKNLQHLKLVQEKVDALSEQHRKNLMVMDIVQQVADGKIDDEEAKNQLAILTMDAIEIDHEDLNKIDMDRLIKDKQRAGS